MVIVVVTVVVVEVPLIGVGAVVVDTVDVVVVELQPVPSDNRRTSLPVSAQHITRSRSPCVSDSDMSYTGKRAKGRHTLGGRQTKGNRAAPCASHSCAETHMPRNDCATDSSGSSDAGSASSSSPCCCLGLSTPPLAMRLIFCDVLPMNAWKCEAI